MNTNEKQSALQNELKRAVYQKPQIEIIEMEHESNILAGSNGAGGDDLTPGGGFEW